MGSIIVQKKQTVIHVIVVIVLNLNLKLPVVCKNFLKFSDEQLLGWKCLQTEIIIKVIEWFQIVNNSEM